MRKFITAVNTIEELLVGYGLLAIAVTACVQVGLRYIFGIAYDWVEELSRYMTILITFVGAGICVRTGAHFSMDALVQYSPDQIKHLLKAVANLVSAVIIAVVFYYAWIQIGKLHRFNATTPSLRIPMFIPYLPIGVFSGVIALRFLVQAGHHIVGFAAKKPFAGRKGQGRQ